VVGGSADVGGGVYEQTLQMAAEGKSVVAFVSLLKSPNFAIIAAPGIHNWPIYAARQSACRQSDLFAVLFDLSA